MILLPKARPHRVRSSRPKIHPRPRKDQPTMNAKPMLRDSYPRPSRCRWYAIPISYPLHRESVPESTTQGRTE